MITVKKTGNSGFSGIKFVFPLAAALFCAACASFQSGDILLERGALRELLDDKSIRPFSKIQVAWRNYPLRNPADSIGEGSISNPKKILPVPAGSGDLEYFRNKANSILADAGIYDPQKGRGTLYLNLTTRNRWTYRDLFSSYLVDTAFIFILPSSIKIDYALEIEYAASSGTVRIGITAHNKTTFHLLMAPLYPFFSPGARERSLLRQLLWRASTEIYGKIKERPQGSGPAPKAAVPVAADTEKQAPAVPPEPPDRTWLPPQKTPEAQPDSDPAADGNVSPGGEIKPAPPERTWIPGAEPPADQTGSPPGN